MVRRLVCSLVHSLVGRFSAEFRIFAVFGQYMKMGNGGGVIFMSYQRQFRESGEYISLGGVSYKIECVEGLGGSSIVYKASYSDGLNTKHSHKVYIKELFPWHPKGYVYREKDGSVVGINDGLELLKNSKLHFRQGNQINLELLNEMPSQVSGNINSFEAYGTYYSVLALHGGESLESYLERRGSEITLKETVLIMDKIITALECFHKRNLLHLDISPDNILIVENQVLLIDYNSVWNITDSDIESFSFSEKAGYTAPEISLRSFLEIGFSTDIYSLCAVFFKMLTGCRLTEKDIYSRGIVKRFSEGLPIFENEAKSAEIKTCQIVTKGLHLIGRKRYQNLQEIKDDIAELLDRINKKGISKAALWESSEMLYKRLNISRSFLPRKLRLSGGQMAKPEQLIEALCRGSQFLIKGSGGIGKTFLLYRIWEDNVKLYNPKGSVFYYVSLKDYQEGTDKGFYIRKSLLKNLSFTQKSENYSDALHELEKLMEGDEPESNNVPGKKNDNVNIVLLLDGLSEAGSRRESLLREIEELSKKASVSVLVTDRTNDVREYALRSFQAAELLPLEQDVVLEELKKNAVNPPEDDSLLELLRNPMMLELYQNIVSMEKNIESDSRDAKNIKDVDGLVCVYLNNMYLTQLKIEPGNREMQLCHKYIFFHLLPDIAKNMVRKKKHSLTLEELCEIVSKDYKVLKKKSFGKAFPEYLGKTRLMFSGIENDDEWFDFVINEQLVGKLGLIDRSGNNSYTIIHDSFLGYLVSVYEKNRKNYMDTYRKVIGTKALLGFTGLVLIVAVVLFVIINNDDVVVSGYQGTTEITNAEYEENLKRALSIAQYNLGLLSTQITTQEMVLDDASASDVLLSSDGENLWFNIALQNKREIINSLTASSLKTELVEQLILANPDIEIEYLQDLCEKPSEMETIANKCFDRLEYVFCSGNSNKTAEEKMRMISTYQAYLNAYTKYCFFQLDYFLLNYAPDKTASFLSESQYSEIFREYFATVKIGEQKSDEVKVAMEYAFQDLNDAKKDMIQEGFTI